MTTTLRHVRVIERGQTFSAWVNPAHVVSIVPAVVTTGTSDGRRVAKIGLTNGGTALIVGTTEDTPDDISGTLLMEKVAYHLQVTS